MSSDAYENETIKRILGGRREEFGILVEKYREKVFAVTAKRIPRDDIEDVAQEAFIRIFRGLAGYAPIKPFENWLTTITLRCCCDYWRVAGRRQERTAPDPEQIDWLERIQAAMSEEAFRALSFRHEAEELLSVTMDRLNAEDRTLIELVYWEDRPLAEAAEVLEWGLVKTKVRLMRARRKLRKIIADLTGSKR
jgi:RNA polymerase sigma-70 factor (ECF subfamily)